MTAQISDTFLFKGDEYALIGMKGGDLISPKQFGMTPEELHSACYRGFYATYEVTDDGLYLKELTLLEKNGDYKPIDGVLPKEKGYQATYENLKVTVPFSGKLRLAKDFIQELYIHMGFQKGTAFRTVYDVTFKEGKVVEVKDRSMEMEEKRGLFKKRYESDNSIQMIYDAFSLDMDLE